MTISFANRAGTDVSVRTPAGAPGQRPDAIDVHPQADRLGEIVFFTYHYSKSPAPVIAGNSRFSVRGFPPIAPALSGFFLTRPRAAIEAGRGQPPDQ